jgi:predicted nucleic acid-binding protein
MSAYFFDTSALKHRYIKTKISARIRRAISDGRRDIYVSELTIVELATAFADDCMQRKVGHAEYDRLYKRFFRDLAKKRVNVRNLGQRDFQNARHLLRFAKVIQGRHLKSADAIIAESCRELAYELNAPITFYLCDEKLFKTLSGINAYSTAVKLRFIHP